MKLLFILLLSSGLSQATSPCEDILYLELKKKKIADMTEREYEYFLSKDKQCNDYMLSNYNSQNHSLISNSSNLDIRKTIDLLAFSTIYGLTILGDIMVDDGLDIPQIVIPAIGPFLAFIPSDEYYIDDYEFPLILSGIFQTLFLYDYIKTTYKNSKGFSCRINPNPKSPYISLRYSF